MAILIKLPSSENDSIVLISAHVLNLVETRRVFFEMNQSRELQFGLYRFTRLTQRVQLLASCHTIGIGADIRYHDNKASFSDVTSRHFQRLSIAS